MSGKEINKRQNESKSLQYLAAQRQIYSEAKTRMNVQIALIVLPPIAICFLKELCIYNTNIVACVILLSFIILVFDRFYLSEQIKEKCCRAAKIQELFDSYVLDIVWNNSLCGSKEEIYRYVDISAEKYKQNKGVEMLKNWYPPEIKSLRGEKARLQCQKINVFWDREIRQSFLFFLICGAIVYIIFVIGALIYHNMSIAQGVIFSSASIAPVFVYVINMIRLNIISEMKLERLRGMFEGGLWIL